MKTHSDMIVPSRVPEIAAETGKSIHTVRSWKQRDSIPAECWVKIAALGLATLDELAVAAERRAAA